MKLIGITGGIGTGKSSVAEMLHKRGWMVVASDQTAKQIMNSDVTVRNVLANLFGDEVLVPNGVDSSLLASKVFGPTEEHRRNLAQLNTLIHPRVLDAHLKTIEEQRTAGTQIMAIETALLFEVELEDGFDWVVVVDAPEEVCIERVMKRSHATAEDVRRRMAEQMSMEEKKGLADFVVDNTTTLEALESAISFVAMIIESFPDPDHAIVEEEAP